MDLKNLESFGLVQSIIFIHELESIRKIDLRKILGLSAGTCQRVLDELIEYKIVEVLPNPKELSFGLTKYGKEIAEKLLELKKIFEKNS
jgi:DNA-binding MarR family transcriptional regulator